MIFKIESRREKMDILARYPKEAILYLLSEANGLNNNDRAALSKTKLLRLIGNNPELQMGINRILKIVPIFQDAKFIDCWNAAFPRDETVCLKTSFGACAYDQNGKLLARSNNKRIGKALCIEPAFCDESTGCVRQEIPSRADPIIGECNHAIIWLLRDLFNLGLKPSSLSDIQIYEAGFHTMNGFKPWWRTVKNYTCLYCLRLFLTFGVETIHGVVGEKADARWEALSVRNDYRELSQKALDQLKRERNGVSK